MSTSTHNNSQGLVIDNPPAVVALLTGGIGLVVTAVSALRQGEHSGTFFMISLGLLSIGWLTREEPKGEAL